MNGYTEQRKAPFTSAANSEVNKHHLFSKLRERAPPITSFLLYKLLLQTSDCCSSLLYTPVTHLYHPFIHFCHPQIFSVKHVNDRWLMDFISHFWCAALACQIPSKYQHAICTNVFLKAEHLPTHMQSHSHMQSHTLAFLCRRARWHTHTEACSWTYTQETCRWVESLQTTWEIVSKLFFFFFFRFVISFTQRR